MDGIYWTGDPAECYSLHSQVAIDSCAEPLAYHPSVLKCKPGTLCNLKHEPQQNVKLKAPFVFKPSFSQYSRFPNFCEVYLMPSHIRI